MPRAPKQCGGCQARVTGVTYCPTCTTKHQARANTTQRGYGHTHQQARAQALAALVDGTPCTRCHQPMHHGDKLDLDHTDRRDGYRGLAHRSCNARAGAYRRGATTPTQGPTS